MAAELIKIAVIAFLFSSLIIPQVLSGPTSNQVLAQKQTETLRPNAPGDQSGIYGQIVTRPDRGVVIYPPVAQTIAPSKIPACPSSRQWVKLDILPIRVIGRRESMDWHRVTPREGAWIGTPMALNSPGIAHQDYLPPGQYDIKVRGRCDGGDEERFFRVPYPRVLHSEKSLGWRDLQMMEL